MIIVRLWYDNVPPEVEIHENDKTFRIKLNNLSNRYLPENKYCIGYLKFEKKYIPHGVRISKRYMCEDCENKDYWIPCAKCNGERCINPFEETRNFCFSSEFYVYLAYFGGKMIKVGIANKDRLIERLLEQGAIAYKIYKKVRSGLEARRIENELKRVFVDKLTYRRKVELYKKRDLDWFESENGIDGILEYNYKNLVFLENKRELKNLNYIPKILGAIGQIVITERGFFNFKKIRGRKIIKRKSILDFSSNHNIKPNTD